ncbi:MAG: HAMP domain-containing histidine kinase, partial [Bacteroidales bacterium]|nr:HAMP domain-containing histidine kinase [Bacteroidales bacterium]
LLLFFIAFLFTSRFIIRKNYSNKLEKVIEDLRNANKQIEEKNKVRDKLFSVISHDLRSPFSGIVGLADIIQSELDTLSKEELMEYVTLIQKTSKQSLEVFENLLHWGRIQSGKINPVFTSVNLHDVTDRISVFFSNNMKLKNLSLENNIDLNCIVKGDADLIEIVIRNIISNAIKFSFSGGKIILKSQKNMTEIIICITNFGTPIPEENLDKLFSINRNISTRGTFNEKGTGLGLFLCKEMMELNEGKIWIQSSNSQSTTFCLLFPIKSDTES